MNGRTALHLALIASLTACAYPLTALLCVWDGKPAGLSAWGMAGLLALLLWLGLGGILLVCRTYYRHPRWVNSALWTLSALAGVGAAFLAPLDTVFFRILLGAAAAGAFFGGTRLLFLPPETLAHPYVFAGVCTWEVAAGLLLRLHCPDASGLPYVLLLAGQSAVFAAAHNQEALRRVLHGRDGEEWELPREVQRRNRLLMGTLLGIGGLLLLCSKPAAHGVRWLLTKILTVLWAALRWFLNCFSGKIIIGQIYEHEVIVCSTGYDLNSTIHQSLAECLCIVNDILLVYFKLRLKCLFKADCFRCDHMHQRSALDSRENSFVKVIFVCDFLTG